MSWNYLLGSEQGTSHSRAGTGCQDEVAVDVLITSEGHDLLVIFVCDGAGSAAQGGTGAELAVEASLAFMEECAAQGEMHLDDDFARSLLRAARAAIDERVGHGSGVARDFACTYLALLSADTLGTLLIQIGDGGIVLDLGDGLRCLTEPMNGEYANSTRFLTEDDFLDVAQVVHVRTRVDRAALFTDGLQTLGVDQATNTPHAPFFHPFFEALKRTAIPEEVDHPLQGALSRFLQSNEVNERTDDDKSLALALWMVPNVAPDSDAI